MTPDNDNRPRLISMKETMRDVPYSRTHIMNLVAAGEFCRPVKLGPKRLAFVRSEVDQWIADRIAARAAA